MDEQQQQQDSGQEQRQQAPSFLDSLPEDLRGNEAFKGFDDAGGIAKAYLEAMGKIPSVPETVDAYAFDGKAIDGGILDTLRAAAHQAGMTVEQFSAIAGSFDQQTQAFLQGETERREKMVNELKAEWGNNYDANVAQSKRAMMVFGTPELSKVLNETGLGEHPEIVKHFRALSLAMKEDSFLGSENKGVKVGPSRTDFGDPKFTFKGM